MQYALSIFFLGGKRRGSNLCMSSSAETFSAGVLSIHPVVLGIGEVVGINSADFSYICKLPTS